MHLEFLLLNDESFITSRSGGLESFEYLRLQYNTEQWKPYIFGLPISAGVVSMLQKPTWNVTQASVVLCFVCTSFAKHLFIITKEWLVC